MSQIITCPACQYTRQETDVAPDWQCPMCQRAYAKIIETQQQNEPNRNHVSPAPSSVSVNAPWNLRLGAAIIDLLIQGTVVVVGCTIGKAMIQYITHNGTAEEIPLDLKSTFFMLGGLIMCIASLVFGLAYHAKFEASTKQATPGKQLFGLIVTDSYGDRLSSKTSWLRSNLRLSTWLLFCPAFATVLFSEGGRAIHDIFANSFVKQRIAGSLRRVDRSR